MKTLYGRLCGGCVAGCVLDFKVSTTVGGVRIMSPSGAEGDGSAC